MKLNPATPRSSSSTSSEVENEEIRQQRCQRCLNHGFEKIRKNHSCPYKSKYHTSTCTVGCRLIDLRRLYNKHINDKAAETAPIDIVGDTPPPGAHSGKRGGRSPTCAACKIHGEINPLRGHKRRCKFSKCDCDKCVLVHARRNVMAEQVKLRRKQQQQTSFNPGNAVLAATNSTRNSTVVPAVPVIPATASPGQTTVIRPQALKPSPPSSVDPVPVSMEFTKISSLPHIKPGLADMFQLGQAPEHSQFGPCRPLEFTTLLCTGAGSHVSLPLTPLATPPELATVHVLPPGLAPPPSISAADNFLLWQAIQLQQLAATHQRLGLLPF